MVRIVSAKTGAVLGTEDRAFYVRRMGDGDYAPVHEYLAQGVLLHGSVYPLLGRGEGEGDPVVVEDFDGLENQLRVEAQAAYTAMMTDTLLETEG